jgi:hypothetical protein
MADPARHADHPFSPAHPRRALFILPESPRLLIKQGRKLQARKNLAWARKLDPSDEVVSREMEEIVEAIKMQDMPPLTVVHKFGGGELGLLKELWWKGNRERVLIALGLMVGQNLTGIQVGLFPYYYVVIF